MAQTLKISKFLTAASLFVYAITLNIAYAGVVTVNTSVSDNTIGGVIRKDASEVSGQQHVAVSNSWKGSSAQATATADYGYVKAAAKGTLSSSSLTGGVTAAASAGFSDNIKLSRDDLNGKIGTVTIGYYIDYSSEFGAGGYPSGFMGFMAKIDTAYSWFYVSQNAGQDDVYVFDHSDLTGRGRINTSPMSYLYVTAQFIWGRDFSTGLTTDLSGGAYVPSGSGENTFFSLDASHSGYWAGIVSATVDGLAVTDYALTSQSGTDYSKSMVPTKDVPEPMTLALFGIGLAGIGIRFKTRS